MYVDVSTIHRNGKSYTRCLLRENYRHEGKVKHRTVANLGRCSPDEIEAVRLAFTHKGRLAELIKDPSLLPGPLVRTKGAKNVNASSSKVAATSTATAHVPDLASVQLKQGSSIGAVWLLHELAHELGIAQALGDDRPGRLALWQVLARVINQGSRLSAVRLVSTQACGFMGLPKFCEDDLYANLDWLEAQQGHIEHALFTQHQTQKKKQTQGQGQESSSEGLFLYDVTSSYLEGSCNELAAFGYNRDGKKGKRQVVIGLLCDECGVPLSIEVFEGNTQDPKTVANQITKIAQRFGGQVVTLVGDRGMIKGPQIKGLEDQGFSYITAITKPQIEGLIKSGVLQFGLFDDALVEVSDNEQGGVRYVLRRNPVRQAELAASHADKYVSLAQAVGKENKYLAEHALAKATLALARLEKRAKKLGVSAWVRTELGQGDDGRVLSLHEDEALKAEHTKLDGCYAIKTNVPVEIASKEVVHARYKDLAHVEWAFRTSKSVLQMRPIYVRLASRTRGHALVVMLAYRLIQELAKCWRDVDLTVDEGIEQLGTLCVHQLSVKGRSVSCIPAPNDQVAQLFERAGIRLPSCPATQANENSKISTKQKLTSRRK